MPKDICVSTNRRVFEVVSGELTDRSMRFSQVNRACETRSLAWVEYGVSFRKITMAEAIVARNEEAKECERAPFAEQPGLVYRPNDDHIAGHRKEITIMHAANRFFPECECAQCVKTRTKRKDSSLRGSPHPGPIWMQDTAQWALHPECAAQNIARET